MIDHNEVKENLTKLLSLTTTSEMTVDTDDVINALTAIEQLQARVVMLESVKDEAQVYSVELEDRNKALAVHADKLESKPQSVEAILYYVDVGDQQKAYEALTNYREQSKCKS